MQKFSLNTEGINRYTFEAFLSYTQPSKVKWRAQRTLSNAVQQIAIFARADVGHLSRRGSSKAYSTMGGPHNASLGHKLWVNSTF